MVTISLNEIWSVESFQNNNIHWTSVHLKQINKSPEFQCQQLKFSYTLSDSPMNPNVSADD